MALALAVNFTIAWWTARLSGLCWIEARALGGGLRALVWATAAQSALGFSLVYLLLIGFGALFASAVAFHAVLAVAATLTPLLLIPVAGLVLGGALQAWILFAREATLIAVEQGQYGGGPVAQAMQRERHLVGPSIDGVSSLFRGDDPGPLTAAWAAVLTGLTMIVGLGALLTWEVLARHTGRLGLPDVLLPASWVDPVHDDSERYFF